MRRVALLALRRSIGGLGLPALLVLVGLHIFARARPWTHEWLWAFYQYHFVTVLLGPAAAGLAGWEGFRMQRSEDLLASARRAGRAVALSWAGVFGWVVVAYSAGLATVIGLVMLSGTPGTPGWPELLSVVPALALLAGESATSFAAGWRFRSPLVAPAAAIVWFLLTLLLYVGGPETGIRVGGATTSLVGLRPRPEVQAAQVLFYSTLAATSLGWARHRVLYQGLWPRVLGLSSVGVLALAGLSLAGLSPNVLERVPAHLQCFGRDPALCAAPGYVRELPLVRAALQPYIVALETIGADVPARFDQSVYPRTSGAAPLPVEIFLRSADGEIARSILLTWYVPARCDISMDPTLLEAFVGLDYWLTTVVDGSRPHDPTVPNVLTSGTEGERADWARGAVAELRACTG